MDAKEFVPIRVSTLRGDLKIDFNVFVNIAGKQILYCRQGDSFEGKRIQRLKEKRLKKMYIYKDQESLYRKYLNQSIETAYTDSSNKPIETRAQVIQGAQQAAAEDVMDDPESRELYNVAKESSRKYVDFIMKETQAFRAIMQVENSEQSVSHHGVTVSTLALGMARHLDLQSSNPMGLLVLGCLLHDIEHHHTNINLARPLNALTKTELADYKTHPLRGAQRMQSNDFFDQIALNIILQHEETIDGSGFPSGLREKDTDALVLLASTANSYDRLVTFEGYKPKDALKSLLIDKVGLHPLKTLQALQEVLKAEKIV